MMQSDVAVRNSIVTAENDDFACAFIGKHGCHCFGCSAVAKNETFAPFNGNTGIVQCKGKAVVVGVGAEKRAVGAAYKGVDTTDALSFFVNFVAVGHHRFFVRNGHVDALPITALKKGCDVHWFYFVKLIIIVADLCMNLW